MRRIISIVAVLALAIGVGACGSSHSASSAKKPVYICTPENTSGCPNQAAERGETWDGKNEGKPSTGEATPAASPEATHTPEEEAHNKSAEQLKQANERNRQALAPDMPTIEKIRREGEKTCYETGLTRAECHAKGIAEEEQTTGQPVE